MSKDKVTAEEMQKAVEYLYYFWNDARAIGGKTSSYVAKKTITAIRSLIERADAVDALIFAAQGASIALQAAPCTGVEKDCTKCMAEYRLDAALAALKPFEEGK